MVLTTAHEVAPASDANNSAISAAADHRGRATSLLAIALSLLALSYFVLGLLTETHGDMSRATLLQTGRALLVPVYLFIAAIIPAGAAFTLLWAERKVKDARRLRLVRALAVLGAGIAIVALAGGAPS
jgi:MFS family permease